MPISLLFQLNWDKEGKHVILKMYSLSSRLVLFFSSIGSHTSVALCSSNMTLSLGPAKGGTSAWKSGPTLILLKERKNK